MTTPHSSVDSLPENTLSVLQKARSPYQIFRIGAGGRWIEVLPENCAPDPWRPLNATQYVAIVNGKAHDVHIRHVGSGPYFFDGGDDPGIEHTYELVANGEVIGTCEAVEY